jgi:hypothetical protein
MPAPVISTDRPCGRRRIQSRSKARPAIDAVETGPAKRPAAAGRRRQIDTEAGQEARSFGGQFAGIGVEQEKAAIPPH